MSKSELESALVKAGFTAETFNSNNAWGFGGGIGNRYERGNVVVKIFTAHSRHIDPVKAITVTISGKRVFDEVQSTKAFESAARRALYT